MFFCDTSLPDAADPYGLAGWQTNSYAFIENPEDPLQQTNFGQPAESGYTLPDAAVNWTASEYTHWNGLTLWGNGALVTQRNDPSAEWGYLVVGVSLRPTATDGLYVPQYNTLVNVTATDNEGLVTNRIADQLFTAPESQIFWGSYTLATEPSSDYVCISRATICPGFHSTQHADFEMLDSFTSSARTAAVFTSLALIGNQPRT